MQAAIRRMGNSAGILLPKTLLAQMNVSTGDLLDLQLDSGRVVLSPVRANPREGWAEAARSLAEAGDDGLVWPEFGNAGDDGLVW